MRITRALAGAALAVGLSTAAVPTGVIGTAHANDVMQGIYTYTQGDIVAEWTIYPSCVPVVGDLRNNMELIFICATAGHVV